MNKTFKFGLILLLVSIFVGITYSTLSDFSIQKTENFFHYTDSYSPIKLPEKVKSNEENKTITNSIQRLSRENNLFFLKQVVDQGYVINDERNFLFLPKTEITLYSPNTKEPKSSDLPLGNYSLVIDDINNSLANNELEGQFFIKTMNQATYDKFVEEFKNEYNLIFEKNYSFEDFSDFNKEQTYELGLNTDPYRIKSYLKIGILFLFVIIAFWVISIRKRIQLLRLNGYSIPVTIQELVGGKYILLLFSINLILIAYISTISIDLSVAISGEIGLLYILLYILLYLLFSVSDKVDKYSALKDLF